MVRKRYVEQEIINNAVEQIILSFFFHWELKQNYNICPELFNASSVSVKTANEYNLTDAPKLMFPMYSLIRCFLIKLVFRNRNRICGPIASYFYRWFPIVLWGVQIYVYRWCHNLSYACLSSIVPIWSTKLRTRYFGEITLNLALFSSLASTSLYLEPLHHILLVYLSAAIKINLHFLLESRGPSDQCTCWEMGSNSRHQRDWRTRRILWWN